MCVKLWLFYIVIPVCKLIISNSFKNEITNNVCKQMSDVKLWLFYSITWNHLTVGKRKKKERWTQSLMTEKYKPCEIYRMCYEQ